MKIDADHDEPVAFLSLSRPKQLVVYLAQGWIGTSRDHADLGKSVDTTRYGTISITHRQGLIKVLYDGQLVSQEPAYWEHLPISDFRGGNPLRRTQFGQWGESGRSFWRRVRYEVANPSRPPFSWEWSASSGQWPDQYQRDRTIQIHANSPDPGPDHGYSSWLVLDDGRIMLVDYTNLGDKPAKSHLVGVYLNPEDLR